MAKTMKRQQYSKMKFNNMPALKRLGLLRNQESYLKGIFQVRMRMMALVLAGNKMGLNLPVEYLNTLAMFLYKYRRLQHFFLAPGIAAFCIDSVKTFDPEYFKRLPECEPVDRPSSVPLFLALSNLHPDGSKYKMQSGFLLHFPVEEHRRSILVIPDLAAFALAPNGITPAIIKYRYGVTDGDDNVVMTPDVESLDVDDPNNACNKPGYQMARLVCGLSLYLDAFPDSIIPGHHEDIADFNYYPGTWNIVTANDIVNEEITRSVDPHYRKGCFHVLRSERFVRKKGQTIWVRGTFVKGTALDVLAKGAQPATPAHEPAPVQEPSPVGQEG